MMVETGYWQQIQAITADREEKTRQAEEAERERRETGLTEIEKSLEQKQARIVQASDLVASILQQIEANAPQIQESPLHNVTQIPHYKEFYNKVQMETKVFLSGSTVTLDWGTKFGLTDEERVLMSRCSRSRLPLLVRNIPNEILEYDFYQILASISQGVVMVGSGKKEGQIVGIQEFVADPTKILPGLASALAIPYHGKSILQRRFGYR
ncbi:MAG: hypothetical protein V1808_04550 [Candidatus Daviesbacteria bacterium]